MKFLRIILLTAVINAVPKSGLIAQESDGQWISAKYKGNSNVLVEISGLPKFDVPSFFVWCKEIHEPPVIIDMIEDEIYLTKTYFLMNKNLKRYSIITVIYYNEDGEVVKSFNYRRNSDVEKYQYNYPILPGSEAEAIFETCMQYMPGE